MQPWPDSHRYQALTTCPSSSRAHLIPNGVAGSPHFRYCSVPQHGHLMLKRRKCGESLAARVIWQPSPEVSSLSSATTTVVGVDPRMDFLNVAPSKRLSPRMVGAPSPSMSALNFDSSS
ncbi:hypothetical protein D9M71_631920 [compost metagenome]